MRIQLVLIFAVATFLSTAAGNAEVVFDNLSPSTPFYRNSGSWFGTRSVNPDLTYSLANGFIPTESGYLDELWLGITTYSTENHLILSLYSESDGDLGTQLWREEFSGEIASYGSLTHLSDLTNTNSPLLEAGLPYWLVAEAPDDVAHSWWGSNTDDVGLWGRADNGVWDTQSSHWRHAMRVGVSDLNVGTLDGDFEPDGDVDMDDIDFYVGNIGTAAVGELAQLDLTDNGLITLADFEMHITNHVQTSNGRTGTYLGDLNLDGTVNLLGDGFTLIRNLNRPATSYGQGDLNLDGTVSLLGDAFTWIRNLDNSNESTSAPSTSAVPEAGSLSLLGLAAVGVFSRRKRNVI